MDMRTDRTSQKAERVCDRNSPLPCICIYLSAYLSLLGINLSLDKQNKVTDKAVGTVQVRTAFQFCERFGVALTQSPAKFDENKCMNPYVDRFLVFLLCMHKDVEKYSSSRCPFWTMYYFE